ncbi:MAG: Fic family protein [Oscillospiraceae bacterium]|nr:Fic family protein [Oscillospiraceae bacterium]
MFSKYDVYTTVQSLYCYADSDVLKNKLNIRNRDELKHAEEEITALKQYMLMESPIKGRFTKTQLMNIHRFLFEDIYPFAGNIRREQISKGDTMFFPPHLISQELDKVFAKLHREKMLHETDKKRQIEHLSYIMSELNVIHPFREGNGRSIRELIRCMALCYGFSLDWSLVNRDTMIDAAVRSVVDSMAFYDIIVKCVVEE